MRVLLEAFLGPGHAHQAQDLDGSVERLLLGRPLVDPDRLRYLAADGPRGVQRCHRVLEDHPDVVATDLSHLGLGQGDKVAPVEPDLPAGDVADVGE